MGKATRESYGIALVELGHENEKVVVLPIFQNRLKQMDLKQNLKIDFSMLELRNRI